MLLCSTVTTCYELVTSFTYSVQNNYDAYMRDDRLGVIDFGLLI